jgi:hypothetical protein
MNKITRLPTTKATDTALWDDYVRKMNIAQKTSLMADGLVARAAWVRFMEAYTKGGNE